MAWICDSCASDEVCKTPDVVKCKMTWCRRYQYSVVQEKKNNDKYKKLRNSLNEQYD